MAAHTGRTLPLSGTHQASGSLLSKSGIFGNLVFWGDIRSEVSLSSSFERMMVQYHEPGLVILVKPIRHSFTCIEVSILKAWQAKRSCNFPTSLLKVCWAS